MQSYCNGYQLSYNKTNEARYRAKDQKQATNIDNLEKLLDKYKEEGRQDTLTANVLLKLHYLKRNRDPSLAIDYLNQAQNIFITKGLKAKVAETYNLTGNVYFMQEMYYLAMDNYFKCYAILQELKEPCPLAYSLNDIANTYYAQNMYNISLNYYQMAASIFERFDNKFGLAVSYNNIALVKRNTGQLDSALYYFRKALLLRQKLNNPFLISHSYNYIGIIYLRKKEYEQALKYFYQSIDTINKIKNIEEQNRIVKAESYMNIGKVFAEQKKYEDAYMNYLFSLVIYESINDFLMVARINCKIGSLKSEQNKYSESLKYLENGLKIASDCNFQNERLSIYFQLYRINNKNKKTDEAFKYLKLYSALSDSINNKNNINKLNEVQIAIQTYIKFKDNAFLSQRNREIKRISFAVVLFLSVFIMFTVYYFHNKRKNEKRWKQLSNATFEGVVIHENGSIIDCNNRFLHITGYSRNGIKNINILDILHPDFRDDVEEKIKTSHVAEYETVIIRKDGESVNVQILSRPSTFKGKDVRVAAMREIIK
jgi:PAS domain S-box-containing protein